MPAVLTSSVSRSLSPPPIALDDPTASDGGPVDAQMTLDTDAGRAPDDAVLQHTTAVEAPADTPVNGTPNNVPVSPQAAVTGNAPINTPGSEATQPGRPATQQGGRRRGRRRRRRWDEGEPSRSACDVLSPPLAASDLHRPTRDRPYQPTTGAGPRPPAVASSWPQRGPTKQRRCM